MHLKNSNRLGLQVLTKLNNISNFIQFQKSCIVTSFFFQSPPGSPGTLELKRKRPGRRAKKAVEPQQQSRATPTSIENTVKTRLLMEWIREHPHKIHIEVYRMCFGCKKRKHPECHSECHPQVCPFLNDQSAPNESCVPRATRCIKIHVELRIPRLKAKSNNYIITLYIFTTFMIST